MVENQQTVERDYPIPDFFICDHLQRPGVRRRMAAALEVHVLKEQGMPVKEIAALLKVHRTTVEQRIDNWRVYELWANQDGKCAGRVRQLINEMKAD